MEETQWREEAYKKAFDGMIKYINMHREAGKGFSIQDLEAMLQTEYDRDGLAWDGRGEVVTIGISANISAMEQELIKWRKELAQSLIEQP
jgi:hypothetical protein